MIFNTPENTGVVSSSGMGSTSVAQIATTAHMFSVLSSRLYSDKVAAVLREIGCNALDAHTAVGTPNRPIEVKLPNALDPTFYVQDWGPGLSEHGVRDLYMTYGKSTKQDSNQFVGAMGLGSKSPFAYTHTFAIVAVRDGVKRYFNAYLNEAGVPVVTQTMECAADPEWPHGLMVTFPVAPADMPSFHRTARSIYRWFAVKPVVLGLPGDEELADVKFKLNKPGLYAAVPDSEAGVSSPAVVMGNIRYPLNITKVCEAYPDRASMYSLLASRNVHLFCGLGEVMFTPSRESLEYDKRTLSVLRDKLDAIAMDISTAVVEKLKQPSGSTLEKLRGFESVRKEFEATGLLSSRSVIRTLMELHQVPAAYIDALPDLSSRLILVAPKEVTGLRVPLAKDAEGRDTYGLVRVHHVGPVAMARSETESRVVVRPVVSGQMSLTGKSDKTQAVAFPVESNFAVVYAESSPAKARKMVRAAVSSGLLSSALLVVPEMGATLAHAKEHAFSLVTPEHGFDGVPVLSDKELEVPEWAFASTKRRPLEQKQHWERTSVLLKASDNRSGEQCTMDAVLTRGTRFYVVTDGPLSRREHQFSIRGQGGDDGAAKVPAATLSGLTNHAFTPGFISLCEKLDAPDIKKGFFVVRPSALRYLPDDAVNLLDFLVEKLSDPEVQAVLCAELPTNVGVAAALHEKAGHWSNPVWSMLSEKANNSPLWKAFGARYAGTKLYQDLCFASEVRVQGRNNQPAPQKSPLFDTLHGLRSVITGLAPHLKVLFSAPGKNSLDVDALFELMDKVFDNLDFDSLSSNARDSEKLSSVMAFIELSLLLQGVMPSPAVEEQTTKAALEAA